MRFKNRTIVKETRSLVFMVGSQVIFRCILFIFTVYAARTLTIEEFGRFSFFRSCAQFIDGIYSGSISFYLLKSFSADSSDVALKNLLVILRLACVPFLAIVVCISYLIHYLDADIFGENNTVISTIFLLLGLLLLLAADSTTNSIANGLKRYGAMFASSILTFLAVAMYLTFSIIPTIVGILFLLISIYVVAISVKIFFLRDIVSKIVNQQVARKPSNLSALIPLVFSTLVSSLAFFYIRYVAVSGTNGTLEIAYFEVLFQILSIGLFVLASSSSYLVPKIVESNKSKIRIIISCAALNFFMSSIFSVLLLSFPNLFVKIFGDKYFFNHYSLYVLCAINYTVGLLYVLQRMVLLADKNWIAFAGAMAGFIVVFVLSFSTSLVDTDFLLHMLLAFYLTYLLIIMCYLLSSKVLKVSQ